MTTISPTSNKKKINKGLVIGISVGGAIFIILFIIIIIVIIKENKHK